jgi:hypothetical protein
MLLLVIPAVIMGSPVLADAQSQNKLRILDRPTITVDTRCNPEGKAAGDFILRNDTGAAASIHLSAGDLSGKSPGKQPAIPTLDPKDGTLDAGKELPVHIAVLGMREDGDWQSAIQNDGADVGTVRVIRNTPPFDVSLDVPAPDAPELTFVEGKPASFRLINADQQEYPIAWEYTVRGQEISSSGQLSTVPDDAKNGGWFRRIFRKDEGEKAARSESASQTGGALIVPSGGQLEVSLSPPKLWFGSSFVGLFKDDVADGRLTVELVDPKCSVVPAISKTFKVKTHLATSAGLAHEGWADFWIFIFLAAGGIFSLGLNAFLPNEMRRLKIKQQLSQLGARISSLSYDLASRLRVLAGLEQRLITYSLRDVAWFSSDFAGQMQSIEQAVTRLGNRLQLLDGLGTTRTNFKSKCSEVLPPRTIFALEETFGKIVEIAEEANPSDENLQSAQALIKSVQDQLDLGVQGDAEFVKSLAAEVTKFKADFDEAKGPVGSKETCKHMREAFPGPFARLKSTDESTITSTPTPPASDLIDLDSTLFELELIRGYVELVEGLAPADDLRKKITDQEVNLLNYLKRRSYETRYAARLLLRQMEEGYFRSDIEKAINDSKFTIKTDRGTIRPYDPCEFKLQFCSAILDSAPARQEWTCRWTFTIHDKKLIIDDPKLVEEGWAVTHYFQEGADYELRITLSHNVDGEQIQVPQVEIFPDGKIHVTPVKRSDLRKAIYAILRWNWTDIKKEWKIKYKEWKTKRDRRGAQALDSVRLAVTLVIALFGLLAGAKEQLLKLDVLPALLAVFMLGFGADQIKNLLTQKPPGADTTSTH